MSGTVWITGASSGLGAALAGRLARDGQSVALSARSADKLDALAGKCAGPGSLHAVPLDIEDAEATRAAVARIEAELGPIGQAVLNAGTHQPVDPRALKVEDFRKLVEVNLMGTVNCLAAVLPPMLARRRGRVAIVASVAGYRGLPTAAAYGMTKAGLINLAEALRVELAPSGIAVQIVNPGFVRTPLTDRNPFPMPFLMEPEDAAEAFFKGLRSDRFEIAFPRRLVWIMKLLRCLPAPLAFAVTSRMLPQERT
ncbi:SDR family NAD(P)-dependent oxidoreductase [Pelagibius sp. 7325]|uniref:SDR family NAD(P)-dependent oxidoreductase n=1 Tax=Pelagibius sp. 7325 TaxID=3131994 RepID=UPI0030ECB3D6